MVNIKRHFQNVDPILASLVDKIGLIPVVPRNNHFNELVESIISQQLSEKAGATIVGRFNDLFPRKKATAKLILDVSDAELRAVGMSWSKVSYVKNVATAVDSRQLDFKKLINLPDEEIIAELTKIKGIGRWTSEMFLMFSLGKPDIFSYGDLGLRRAIERWYSFKAEPSIAQMKKIVDVWAPYRTYASRVLWQSLTLKD